MNPELLALMTHERTLLGAIDSYLGALVRVQPQLAARHGAVLEDLAERWIEGGQANEIDAVTASWVRAFLASVEDRELAGAAVQQFFAWAGAQQLIDSNPAALAANYLK